MSASAVFRGADPADLAGLRDALRAADPRERLASIGMKSIAIGANALEELPALVEGVRGPGEIIVLQDRTPMRRNGADLKSLVAELVATLGSVRVTTIGIPGAPLHADAAALAEADAAVHNAGCVVVVGSGTITDIAKDATHRMGGSPLVVVQTAVSVNAFSDDMAVLLRDGVKRTVPSRWPDVLVVDRDVITDAPAAMNRAGFGELASMFTAPADWYLASAIGVDESFHPAVVSLFRDSAEAYLGAAEGVGAGDGGAIEELARIMTLSGIALGVTGKTAPMSGTEHLVSHLLDMAAAARGAETALHGAQVGVASVIVALAWRRLLVALQPADLASSGDGTMRADVLRAFSRLDATGVAAEECWRAYDAKSRALAQRSGGVQQLARDWATHRARIEEIVLDPGILVAALERAGAPTRFRDLDPPVDAQTARWALRNCFLMRDRLTVVDIAHRAGLWDDRMVDELLDEAAELGAGL